MLKIDDLQQNAFFFLSFYVGSLKDHGDYEENNSARVTNKDGDESTHGDFEENNSARVTTKDSDESTLGGLSSPEEYLYDSLEEGQKTRLSNRIIGRILAMCKPRKCPLAHFGLDFYNFDFI